MEQSHESELKWVSEHTHQREEAEVFEPELKWVSEHKLRKEGEEVVEPELKWVSEHKLQKEEEEVVEEDVGLQVNRSRNGHGHGQNGDNHSSFDGNGNGTSSTVTSAASFSSESKYGAESGFQFTDDEGLGTVEGHMEEHADAGEAESKNSNSVYFDREQGTDSANGFSEVKSNVVESFPIESTFGIKKLDVTSQDFDIQKNSVYEFEHQVGEVMGVESFSDPSMLPVGKSLEEENTNDNSNNNTGADEIVDLIEEECDLDVPDLDVEGVIAKQETHDLVCPNCHCQITKTVILRRKKIKLRKARPHKRSKEVRPELDANTEPLADDQGERGVDSRPNDDRTPVTEGNVQVREADVFRCLSCFSFFIPEGGFFRIFRPKNDNQAPQSPQHIPAPAASTIVLNDRTTAVEQDTFEKGNSSLTSYETGTGLVIDQTAMLPAIKAPQDGLNGLVHSNGESVTNGTSEEKVNQVTDTTTKYEVLPGRDGLASYSQPVYRIVENDGANGPQKVGMDVSNSSVQEYKQPETPLSYPPDKLLDFVQQNKTESTPNMTVAPSGSEPAGLEREQDIVGDSREETPLLTDTRIDVIDPVVADSNEPREWDILKSIVYGGLIELITSLGVVSSAAGAGAASLNIMALGVANLIGGLFIIAHNLGELRSNSSGETSSETTAPQGRYYELLGRREKFKLHTVIVILSFLIFGALPPIVYGFSFRVSNDRDYKLAVVAASSLLCIVLLAIGKGHVQTPHKSYFKTVLYYLTIGVMASGASYLAGVLLDKLLKDLGLFESSLVTNVPFQELRSEQQLRWASY